MTLEVEITAAPLAMPPCIILGCGAVVRFEGIVRPEEEGAPVSALEYEAYQPMAENEIRRILIQLGARHAVEHARVYHRVGLVPAGEAALLVEIHARHRHEAFRMVESFVEHLKQDVPIWKIQAIGSDPSNHA